MDYILAVGRASDSSYMYHLQSRMAIANYIRIADEISRLAHRRQRRNESSDQPCSALSQPTVLDWGAGFGQLSYLLAARDCAVTSYDIGAPGTYPLPIEPIRTIIRDEHPSRLPFTDESFDVVVSCGVLEHVPDDAASIDEIHRVLRPHGLFAVYNLPQRWGYIELLVRTLKLGYTHERYYTQVGVRRLLAAHGFKVSWMRRSNMLPYTFRGLPGPIRAALTDNAGAMLAADRALAKIPLLSQFAGILELLAIRDDSCSLA
jgi:SAM-dependent methyltransferase